MRGMMIIGFEKRKRKEKKRREREKREVRSPDDEV